MKGVLTRLVFAVLFVGLNAMSTSSAQAQAAGQPKCPCFTSQMIDAGLVSLGGSPESETAECSQPGQGFGNLEAEFEITTTDGSSLFAGVGYTEPPVGICEIEVSRNGGGTYTFTVDGDEPDVEFSTGQIAACVQEILQSYTWGQFCAPQFESGPGR